MILLFLCCFVLRQDPPQNLDFKDRLDSLANEFNRFSFGCHSGMGYRHVLWILDMPDPGPCACIALLNEPSSLYGVIQPNRAPSNSLC